MILLDSNRIPSDVTPSFTKTYSHVVDIDAVFDGLMQLQLLIP